MPESLVAAIILNTNRREDTLECLASLGESTYSNLKVIVLDNDSTDGSPEAIRQEFPAVEVIHLKDNKGYAGNNNVGIEAAMAQGADWIWVINEDTIIAPDCLTRLVAAGEADSRIGIVGPMVYHHDEPEIIQSAGGKLDRYWRGYHLFENELDKGKLSKPRLVDWISGCAILVRRSVIEEVGGLDERFFYYWEETEWCVRATRAGWGIVQVPKAKIWHKGVRRDYRPTASVTYFATRNHLLLLSKHNAPPLAKLLKWLMITRTLASWTIRPRWRSKRDHRYAMWRGAVDYLRKRWGGPVQL